jgi:hypothetical protein
MSENAHFPAVDPKVTEGFLLSQQGVLDASVWYVEGVMHAHVTLADTTEWTPRTLRLACACELGLHYTPREFVVLNARTRAA